MKLRPKRKKVTRIECVFFFCQFYICCKTFRKIGAEINKNYKNFI